MPEELYFNDILKILPFNYSYDISIYIKKIDAIKAVNDITYNIGLSTSQISNIKSNQRNSDIINKKKDEAIELRKKIQTENQDVYYINFIITFYSYDFNELVKFLSQFKSKLYSRGILSEVTNFRHKDVYLSNLPINIKKSNLFKDIIITTDALSNLFVFFKNNILDINGIIIGRDKQNYICKLDIWDKKYENSNMCIFGSSGSGKSFFTKLFCIRNYMKNTCQVILDIEEEYISLCKKLDGQVLFNGSYYNILQITHEDLKIENYLIEKVKKVVSFISYFREIDKEYFTSKILLMYKQYGITEEKNTVLIPNIDNNIILDEVIISRELFPTLTQLISYIDNKEQLAIFKNLLENELEFFSKSTTIDTNNRLYVIDAKNIIKYPNLIKYILNNILLKNTKQNTVIIIDELWKYAKVEYVLDEIFTLYKTIRKRGASIICITQDVNDFFEYKNGFYANSILNNCNFKIYFKLEYEESNKYMKIPSDINLKLLKKGEAILNIGENYLKFNVNSTNFEREIINEDDTCSK